MDEHAPVLTTPGAWPLLWLGSLAAVYACVPETDRLPIVGGVLGGFLLVELVERRPFPPTAQLVIAGVIGWAAWHGAAGQTRAEIGGLFAASFPAAVVVVASILPKRIRPPERGRWAIAGIGVAAALIVARTGALQAGAGPVLASMGVWVPLALAASAAVIEVCRRTG